MYLMVSPAAFIRINISEVQDDLFQIGMARKDVAQELEPLPQPRLVPLLFPQRHGPLSDYATVSAKN